MLPQAVGYGTAVGNPANTAASNTTKCWRQRAISRFFINLAGFSIPLFLLFVPSLFTLSNLLSSRTHYSDTATPHTAKYFSLDARFALESYQDGQV